MGKILTTTYQESVDKISGLYERLVDNPFYAFSELKPTLCTYYSINRDLSSLDVGAKFIMDNIGKESPLRYNRIYDFMIYGFNRIQLQTELDEFGLESDKISGDCVVLPNTFEPVEGDYFEVEHIKDSTYLFIVTDVQKDTLNNGANAYKISYKLEYNQNVNLVDKVAYNFRAIESRNGTNILSVVRCEDYDLALKMDAVCVTLKQYFQELFYYDKVQTFIYEDLTEFRIYDPYMIEFLIRHKILSNDDLSSYIHVCHQIKPHNTFTIDYDETFFRAFELRDIKRLLKSKRHIIPEYMDIYGSIFHSRFESYYKARYVDANQGTPLTTYCLGDDFIYAIQDHALVSDELHECELKPELWKNIIIKYFYKEEITEEELESVTNLKFEYAKNAYYIIPLLIFCLENLIVEALK